MRTGKQKFHAGHFPLGTIARFEVETGNKPSSVVGGVSKLFYGTPDTLNLMIYTKIDEPLCVPVSSCVEIIRRGSGRCAIEPDFINGRLWSYGPVVSTHKSQYYCANLRALILWIFSNHPSFKLAGGDHLYDLDKIIVKMQGWYLHHSKIVNGGALLNKKKFLKRLKQAVVRNKIRRATAEKL